MDLMAVFQAFCVGLGGGHLAAAVAVLARYAIPRSPGFFHAILAPPMIVAGISVALIGLALSDDQGLGAYRLELAAAYVVSSFVVWWGLIAYSIYFHFRGRHRRRETRRTGRGNPFGDRGPA